MGNSGSSSSTPYEPVPMAELFKGVQLKKHHKDGAHTTAVGEEALKDKIVGLYFSAHWCPPCRAFTPVLKDFYNDLVEADADFEIVFVSFDRSDSDLQSYLKEAHGDWYYLPFGADKIKELAAKFEVSGIPALIIVRPDGTIVTKNGRADVQAKPPKVCLSTWKKE